MAGIPGPLCLDENGRPVGAFRVFVGGGDGRTTPLVINESGVIETALESTITTDVNTTMINFDTMGYGGAG